MRIKKRAILKGGYVYFIVFSALIIALFYFITPILFPSSFVVGDIKLQEKKPEVPEVIHIKTPAQVHAIYMTSCAASSLTFRQKLVEIASTTEINSIVIDVKDYTGTISFDSENSLLKGNEGLGCKVPDLKDLVKQLHEKGIYVIARISSFQDSYLVKIHPELAVKKASDGSVWQDFKGVKWLDAGSKDVWDYLVAIGRESYALGFDELNFDYIRFPSDGNMKDIYFPYSNKLVKHEVMRSFFKYLRQNLNDLKVPLSADMFGMVTTTNFDLNIGQMLEDALPYFDYISPMVYPSHYPATWNGFANPADHPYEVIKLSMEGAILKVANLQSATTTSTSTDDIQVKISTKQIRPWLQDFNLGATYTADMVRAQIQATYDVGLDSWMLWNASNRYTKSALLPK